MNRWDVAEPGAQRAEKHADGDAVDADKDDAWDVEQCLRARPEALEQRDHHIDQEIVGEDDQMAPDGLINVDAERMGPLAMNTLQPSSTSWEMNCQAMKPKATKEGSSRFRLTPADYR